LVRVVGCTQSSGRNSVRIRNGRATAVDATLRGDVASQTCCWVCSFVGNAAFHWR